MKHLIKPIVATSLCACFAFGTFAGAGCNNTDQLDALDNKSNSIVTSIEDLESQIASLQEENDKLSALLDKIGAEVLPEEVPEGKLASNYGQEAYDKLVYLDKNVKDRDFIYGDKFEFCQKWITWELMKAGYSEDDVVYQNFDYTTYVKKANEEAITADYDTDGKEYVRSGWSYTEATEEGTGTHVKATIHTANLIVTHKGKTDKQIIIGAHYDGSGSGDNASSVALAVTTLQHLKGVETEYTLKFVFFSAEEYGKYGSKHYADNMSQEEIDNTLYMINMDSLGCGDYTYIYGGVADDDTKTVTKTEAFDNAMAISKKLGLDMKSNPWTYDNPTPGYDTPLYAAPSTGDWSDHAPFKDKGITYLYFEATNWEIPGPYNEYDGYGETYLVGMIMNTPKDYLEYIETYFPGRPLSHLTTFSTLLNALITQTDYQA